METETKLANPHGLTHSIHSDTDGRYCVRLYLRGRYVGGAGSYQDSQKCIRDAYSYYYETNGSY